MRPLLHFALLGALLACGEKEQGATFTDTDGYGDSAAPELPLDDSASGCTVVGDGLEHCDNVDEDCDGRVDEHAVNPGTWWSDGDGDGYGNAGIRFTGCNKPGADWVLNDADCDDAEVSVYPGAPEVCGDLRDNDCDGLYDAEDDDAEGRMAWYDDHDYDGYGAGEPTWSCRELDQLVELDGDCDDFDRQENPGAEEDCNDGDDADCDGAVDEGCP